MEGTAAAVATSASASAAEADSASGLATEPDPEATAESARVPQTVKVPERPPTLEISGFIRKFDRGVSEAFLLRASGSRCYATKFTEKAQGRGLGIAREFAAGQLAPLSRAQVPGSVFLELSQQFIDLEARLTFGDNTRPSAQLTAGVVYLPPMSDLPDVTARLAVCPPGDIASVLVFNTWVAVEDRGWDNYSFNWDSSEVRFSSIDYAASMSLGPGDSPRCADLNELKEIARANMDSVKDALDRLEAVNDESIDAVMSWIPAAWMDPTAATRLGQYLKEARRTTRGVLTRDLA